MENNPLTNPRQSKWTPLKKKKEKKGLWTTKKLLSRTAVHQNDVKTEEKGISSISHSHMKGHATAPKFTSITWLQLLLLKNKSLGLGIAQNKQILSIEHTKHKSINKKDHYHKSPCLIKQFCPEKQTSQNNSNPQEMK